MLKRKPELLHFTILFFLVFLTYQESLNNYFLADDALWLMQAKKAEQSVLEFFQPVGGFLRPMVTFTYFVIYKFFNLNPAPYYLFCVVLHFVNCIVLYYFCLEFFRAVRGTEEKNIAFFSAVLFSVLYSHCEAVIWIGALGDSFLLLFCLLSFIFFLKSLNHRVLSLPYLLSLIFQLLALLSKEIALVFPAILLTFSAVFRNGKYARVAPYILLSFVYAVLYKVGAPGRPFWDPGSAFYVIPSLLKGFGIIVISLFGFSSYLLWIFSEVNAQLYTTKVIFQCIACGAALFYGYACFRGAPYRLRASADTMKVLFFFVCFVAITYLPIVVRIPRERAAGEITQTSLRYFYFPDSGFSILVAFVLSKIFQRHRYFILQNVFAVSLVVLNVIPVYQTEWSYNFFGLTRKHLVERVVSLHERYKDHPYILLIDYPGKITVHLHTHTLLPLFHLYGKNVFFTFRELVFYKVKNLSLSRVCFFEWTDVTFVDKTAEYVRLIEKQRKRGEHH